MTEPAIAERVDEPTYPTWQAAVAPGARDLYLVTGARPDSKRLIRYDLNARKAVWRLELANDQALIPYGGTTVVGDLGLAVSPDGSRIYLAPAFNAGVEGIAIVDTGRPESMTFFGPFITYGPIRSIRDPGGDELVIAPGTRGDNRRGADDTLFVWRVPGWTVDHTFPPPGGLPNRLVEIEASRDGDRVFVASERYLGSYSLSAKSFTRTVPRRAFGPLALSPDESVLVQSDCGYNYGPSSGLVRFYTPTLDELAVVDLNPHAYREGLTPCTYHMAFSRDGRLVYVGAGTNRLTLDFAAEPARVFSISLADGQVLQIFDPDDWAPAWLFTLP